MAVNDNILTPYNLFQNLIFFVILRIILKKNVEALTFEYDIIFVPY